MLLIVKADNAVEAHNVVNECLDDIVLDSFDREKDVVTEIDTEEKAKKCGYLLESLVYHLNSNTEDISVRDVLEE